MGDAPSSAPPAPQPAGLRPEWVHPARSATAFWMPTAIVMVVTLVLVLLWPRNHRSRTAHPRNLPEATASYVVLEGAYLVPPGDPGRSLWPGSGSGALPPEREDVTTRRLPLPEYTGLGVMSPWAPTQLGFPSNDLPSLAERPVAAVLAGAPPPTNSVAVVLSPGLQRSGFRFDVPAGVVASLPATVRFHVELDARGDVIHLLSEPGDNPESARLLETAVSRGHGTRAGRGEVTVSWGR